MVLDPELSPLLVAVLRRAGKRRVIVCTLMGGWRHRGIQASALALACGMTAVVANAATPEKADGPSGLAALASPVHPMPIRGARLAADAVVSASLSYHGGPVITSAKVVFIFWGPSFADASSPDQLYAQTLQAFRNQFGTTLEYNVITQYSGIQQANLGSGTPDWFDTSTPPTNVTDAIVRGEVNAYLASHAFDASTIYEVVIPSSSYSSSGNATSCGGPNVAYCAYHGYFTSGANAVKYSIEPYPSCGGCQVTGWTAVQNQEHFVCHETREAVTDEQSNAWYDFFGFEADDKCAWSPTPFIGTGGYSYQYEWSNATSSCVQTLPIPSGPGVTTNGASGISATAATLGGTVYPEGASTNAYFQWGTTLAYGNTTAAQNVGAGTTAVPISANLTGLQCGTPYHVQAVASNAGGTGYGGDQSFTTAACPASFYTVPPCRILDTRPLPLTGNLVWEFGIAPACGIPATATAISANVTGLDATAAGYLTFWPAQAPRPNTSTLDFGPGQVRANNAILLLAPGLGVTMRAVWFEFSSAGKFDLIIDVNGYFQ
jgi:hypothetical protein